MIKNVIDEVALRRLYIDEMKTDVEIAAILGYHKQTVWRTRNKFDIKAFKRWQRNICNPTERQLQIIYGSLLGDASISNGKKGIYDCESIFELHHCAKQKEYLFWKYDELKNLCRSMPKEDDIGRWRLRTFHHPFFSNLRKQWYPNGTKCVKSEFLDKLGSLGLAVWYMDDGTRSLKISTCAFSETDHEILIEWLKNKFDIRSRMAVYSGYRVLLIKLESRNNFLDIVKPYIVPCLRYKVETKEVSK